MIVQLRNETPGEATTLGASATEAGVRITETFAAKGSRYGGREDNDDENRI